MPAGTNSRTAGERIVQAILAGSFTEHPRREIDIDDPCTQCGAELAARYDDEVLAIDCPDCGHGHGEYPFPPGGLHDRSDAEILEAFDQRVRHLHCLAKDGVCPECSGRMNTTIERDGECCLGTSLRADHVCEQCNHQLCSAVGLGLLDHSAVVTFYGDHGVALSETPYWRLGGASTTSRPLSSRRIRGQSASTSPSRERRSGSPSTATSPSSRPNESEPVRRDGFRRFAPVLSDTLPERSSVNRSTKHHSDYSYTVGGPTFTCDADSHTDPPRPDAVRRIDARMLRLRDGHRDRRSPSRCGPSPTRSSLPSLWRLPPSQS